jgi:hypothetical protein
MWLYLYCGYYGVFILVRSVYLIIFGKVDGAKFTLSNLNIQHAPEHCINLFIVNTIRMGKRSIGPNAHFICSNVFYILGFRYV